MNDTISLYAHLVSIDKDITLIQTKNRLDLLQIQTIGIERFNLFHFKKGSFVQILNSASRTRLTDKITNIAIFDSMEDCFHYA